MFMASGFEMAIVVIGLICLGIFFGGSAFGTWKMEEQAIERGYAIYCPVNGKFAWKNEC